MIIRSTGRIATLALTSPVMGVLTAGMMRAPAFGQTSQVDNADWPSSAIPFGRLDTPRRTRT